VTIALLDVEFFTDLPLRSKLPVYSIDASLPNPFGNSSEEILYIESGQ